MSNGKIADANVEALLVGVPPEELPRMRFILTTLSETKTGLEDLRDVCESRATICPGLALADPVAARTAEQENPESADFTEQRRGPTGSLSADEEMGDMRRAWRVVRWGVAAFVLPIIATGGYRLGQIIFG